MKTATDVNKCKASQSLARTASDKAVKGGERGTCLGQAGVTGVRGGVRRGAPRDNTRGDKPSTPLCPAMSHPHFASELG